MTLTAEQLSIRANGVGSSEVADVLFGDALKVYMRKVGLLDSEPENDLLRWGNKLEPVIAAEYAEVTGRKLVRGTTVVHRSEPWMIATPDFLTDPTDERFAPSDQRVVECKNRNAWVRNQWGEAGTDEVPVAVAAQCMWQMMVLRSHPEWAQLHLADAAVLIGGNDFRIYHLEYDEELAESIKERVRRFWFENVMARVPPRLTGSATSQLYVKLRWPTHGESFKEASDDIKALIHKRQQLVEERQRLDGLIDEVEVLIKDFIGDAEGCRTGDGWEVTWRLSRGNVDWKKAALDHGVTPEEAERYRGKGSRRLHFSKEAV